MNEEFELMNDSQTPETVPEASVNFPAVGPRLDPMKSLHSRFYLPLAFAAPCASMLLLMLVAGYTPFGDKSMLYSDMWHQYYPFFKNFREALLSGDSLLYSWDIGMGIDYLGLISYYLASPLNLISVLLPESWMQGYFGLLVPLKLGFAGLFFAIFLRKVFGKEDLSIVLFGWFYGMCAWALGYQWNVMWLDTFALLPLVVTGTLSLLKERKFVLYTATLFLSIYANYYIGFFTCIFTLLVFICYQICQWKNLKRFVTDFALMGVFTVLAIGMTAFLELPALASLKVTQSSVNTFPDYFSLNIVSYTDTQAARAAWDAFKAAQEAGEAGLWDLWWTAMKESMPPILDGMRQIAGNMGGGLTPTFKEGLPNLYCGVGTIMLAFLYLTADGIKIREKICCVFLLLLFMLSFLIRQLDYVWHGFHFTNMIPYRFSFLFSFVMLFMAYRAFLMRRKFQLWQIVPAGMLTACILLLSKDVDQPVYITYNATFLLLYLVIFIMPKADLRKPPKENRAVVKWFCEGRRFRRTCASWMLVAVMALELFLNLVNFGVKFPYTALSNYPKGTYSTASMIQYMKEDKDLFYRAEVTHTQTLNDSALNGYNGISTFTSSANVAVTEFMKNLGYGAKNTYNRYCYEEASPVANLFLNLKYMIERDGNVEENAYFDEVWHYNRVYLLENNAYLPLGFLAESQLADLDFEGYSNRFAMQNALFSAATGNSQKVWKINQGSTLTINPNGTNITSQSSAGYCAYSNGSAQTTLTYHYEFTDAGFFCLDITMSARNNYTVWKNGKQLFSESISLPQTMAVSQVEPGDEVDIQITCKAGETGSITIRGGLLADDIFRDGYQVLAASTLQLTEFSNTSFSGIIDCNRDGLMYTSVPQNGDSWAVYVDGQQAPIKLVGGCMIAVDLTEGVHEIEFRYTNKAFDLGLIISLGCLVAFLAIVAFVYKPWQAWTRKGKYEK